MSQKQRGPKGPVQLVAVSQVYRKSQQRFELIKAYWHYYSFMYLIARSLSNSFGTGGDM